MKFLKKFLRKNYYDSSQRIKQKTFGDYFSDTIESQRKGLTDQNLFSSFGGGSLDRTAALCGTLINSLESNEIKTLGDIYALELPSLELNAFGGKDLSGKNVVVVNSGLISFAYTAFNIWLLKISNPSKVRSLLKNTLLKYFPQKNVKTPNSIDFNIPSDVGGPGGAMLKNVSVMCMELFIICHEVGHHLLGHLSASKLQKHDLLDSVYKRERDEEYQADRIAFKLYSRLLEGKGPKPDKVFLIWTCMAAPQGALGYDMMFSFMDLAYHLLGARSFTEMHSTHPSPIERREKLRDLYFKRYGKDEERCRLANTIADFCIKYR